MTFSSEDEQYMRQAIRLSRQGIGYTEPNPLVGAVVVHEGRVVTTGYHSRYGAYHAEREALSFGDIPEGATLYVTLEPCTHYGKTPPCLDIILEKKIQRVVVAAVDPGTLVCGKGLEALRSAGVRVDLGCLADEAEWVNRHYLTYIRKKRPHIVIKSGLSADGKMSDASGNSSWVTSEELRCVANDLRGEFSAVLVGSATILADDPSLTIRNSKWPGKKLLRIVLDGSGRLVSHRFLRSGTEQYPVLWVVSSAADLADPEGVENLTMLRLDSESDGRIGLETLMAALHEMGIASVLVEGGAVVSDGFLSTGLVDEVILFTASALLGGQEALTPFASGRPIDSPLRLLDHFVIELESGWIVRGRV